MGKTVKLKNNICLDYSSIRKYARNGNNGDDFNDYTTSGYYIFNEKTSIVNSPVGSSVDGILVVEETKKSNMLFQLFYDQLSNTYSFRVYWFGIVWRPWKKI